MASSWATRFFYSAIVQGAFIFIWATYFFIYGSVALKPTPASIIAAGSAGTWLFVGFLAYIIMILYLGVTSYFYSYVENTMKKKVAGSGANPFAWVHFIFSNVGIMGSTWLLMAAGYLGGSALVPTSSGGLGLTELQTHIQILQYYPVPIIIFIVILMLGVLSGGISYILTIKSRRR